MHASHSHFIDRLIERVDQVGSPVCVGIDPVYPRLPAEIRRQHGLHQPEGAQAAADALEEFGIAVLETVHPHATAVKYQSACFERFGWRGVRALEKLIEQAKERSLVVILDAKRGDIGSSAEHYAAGCLAEPVFDDLASVGPDALTVNSYLGPDSLEPFVKVAAEQGKGLFALVRTSNPGGDALQSQRLSDGRLVVDCVAAMISNMAHDSRYMSQAGYSLLGAVVGATRPEDARRLRQIMPRQWFLVPGFGAQGGTADDVRACFDEKGHGALITASRSITYAYGQSDETDWRKAIEEAARRMNQQIAACRAD
jgi:orotidine-5'-phosphate decarboxylase